ncbi:hypothetical protein P691DRAFT_734743 [Macrolepiota fuliginosa MF-IS2]|uniref:Uncharacterized protein n=1 Tax=Macrolepiota fuliginosa MF-IS2 TaxID=1400762 RepID=A0A9P6C1F1_9AGAR|nr:hypothetical protein P691DRAFT_734743 [Macrolepiota fuliginosa MF-IS2]
MDLRLVQSDTKIVGQRITRLAMVSCCISFTAFACSIPLLGRKFLYLSPFACVLTLLHHGLIFHDRSGSGRNTTGTILLPFTLPSLKSPPRLPMSARVIMILIVWVAGMTWLAVSTIVASLLGVLRSSEEVEYYILIAEVILSLLEANTLLVMVIWCFREREAICREDEVRPAYDYSFKEHSFSPQESTVLFVWEVDSKSQLEL